MDKFNGVIGKDRQVAPVYCAQFINDGTGGWQQKLHAETEIFHERQGPPGPTAVATLRIETRALAPSLTVPAYLTRLGRQSMKCTSFVTSTIMRVIFALLLAMAVGGRPANAQSFVLTGPMSAARFAQTATLLNDGTVLIAGGVTSGGGSLASAELYNPATGIFTPTTGSMNTPRAWHTATLLNTGLVLITGGCDGCAPGGNGTGWASAELYNPATGTFTATGSMMAAREYHTAALLNNGMVLIAGGDTNGALQLASAELYDPATGIFTATGSMTTPRQFPAATLLNDGTVLVLGGQSAIGSPLSTAEIYNPATGTFTPTTSSMTSPCDQLSTATLLNNGMVLIAGGARADAGAVRSQERDVHRDGQHDRRAGIHHGNAAGQRHRAGGGRLERRRLPGECGTIQSSHRDLHSYR